MGFVYKCVALTELDKGRIYKTRGSKFYRLEPEVVNALGNVV